MIKLFSIEPTQEQILHDFPVEQPFDLFDDTEEYGLDLPIDYFDNDDGFWDEYIKQQQEHYAT